ncbi:hypothetical protein AAFF_G00323750 [Aldrovandia affinis]|uniref:Uncharacterized protein n=1 Tax=Aldrovandia affinis TaxID=143900 RepID=A0AAD7R6T4_9TELE|nr:hypothetical protein AAFF_G00323750 [Aldrovandia affinis]
MAQCHCKPPAHGSRDVDTACAFCPAGSMGPLIPASSRGHFVKSGLSTKLARLKGTDGRGRRDAGGHRPAGCVAGGEDHSESQGVFAPSGTIDAALTQCSVSALMLASLNGVNIVQATHTRAPSFPFVGRPRSRGERVTRRAGESMRRRKAPYSVTPDRRCGGKEDLALAVSSTRPRSLQLFGSLTPASSPLLSCHCVGLDYTQEKQLTRVRAPVKSRTKPDGRRLRRATVTLAAGQVPRLGPRSHALLRQRKPHFWKARIEKWPLCLS